MWPSSLTVSVDEGVLQFPATDAGTAQLLSWTSQLGTPRRAGLEGTGSYGYQLTRRAANSRHGGVRSQPTRPGQPTPQGQERPGRRGGGRSGGAIRSGHGRAEDSRGGGGSVASLDDCPEQRGESHHPGEQPDQGTTRWRPSGAARPDVHQEPAPTRHQMRTAGAEQRHELGPAQPRPTTSSRTLRSCHWRPSAADPRTWQRPDRRLPRPLACAGSCTPTLIA